MTPAPKVGERRRLSKRATLGLLDEMDADGARRATICVSPETLAAGDWLHLLPESDPARTLAASGVSGIGKMVEHYSEYAPLRAGTDKSEVGDAAVFLLSRYARGITGEVLHVDSGFHSVGATIPGLSAD